MYYQRFDVREAILCSARSSNGIRECAIYNSKFKSLQRYFGENGSRGPIRLNRSDFDRILQGGASAFYCSYWCYDGMDFTHPIGRDLVWVIRTKHGSFFVTKFITKLVLDALEEAGVKAKVKYSGDLGFDVVIPLETIPYEGWMGDLKVLDDLHQKLSAHIIDYIRERFPEVEVEGHRASATIRIGDDICLLSELRVRRGLLLAPMSLNPRTGMVSVPIDSEQVNSFKILDADPQYVKGTDWSEPVVPAYGLLRYMERSRFAAAEAVTEAT